MRPSEIGTLCHDPYCVDTPRLKKRNGQRSERAWWGMICMRLLKGDGHAGDRAGDFALCIPMRVKPFPLLLQDILRDLPAQRREGLTQRGGVLPSTQE